MAAALLASVAASVPGVALASERPYGKPGPQPIRRYLGNRRDPLAAERTAHNKAVDAKKAAKRARQGRR